MLNKIVLLLFACMLIGCESLDNLKVEYKGFRLEITPLKKKTIQQQSVQPISVITSFYDPEEIKVIRVKDRLVIDFYLE